MHLELAALRPGALSHDAPVVRHVGRLHEQVALLLGVVHPLQGALVLLRRQFLLLQLLAAAGGDQHEGMEADGAEVLRQLEQVGQVMGVELGDSTVDLHLHARRETVAHALHGPFEGAGDAAELVVLRRAREVDADADARDAHVVHATRDLGRHQRTVGRHDRAQPAADGVLGDVEDVGAHERVAAGEDQDRAGERGDLVDEGEALLGAELALVRAVDRRGAAVRTREVAAARDLPGDDARRRDALGGSRSACAVRVAVEVFSVRRVQTGSECARDRQAAQRGPARGRPRLPDPAGDVLGVSEAEMPGRQQVAHRDVDSSGAQLPHPDELLPMPPEERAPSWLSASSRTGPRLPSSRASRGRLRERRSPPASAASRSTWVQRPAARSAPACLRPVG